nr:DUF1796 family putative cysteine peptidase [Oceanusvirus sp.]
MRLVHIPVGINCDVTSFLIRTGRRREAMPFDWTMCTLDRIADLIDTDFAEWMSDLRYMRVGTRTYADGRVKKAMHQVWCASSGVLFLHDFQADEDAVECERQVKEKYQRRIARFRKLCESGKARLVFVTDACAASNVRNAKFLRGVAEDEPVSPDKTEVDRQAARLAEAIARRYPKLEFAIARLVKDKRLVVCRDFVANQ